MKLEYGERPDDMRDKIIVKVSRLKRTPKGFRCTESSEMQWRAGDDSLDQYLSISKLVSTLPPTYKGKLVLLTVEKP